MFQKSDPRNGSSFSVFLQLPAPDAPYYTTDAFADYAIQFVDEQKDDRPFFLYLAFNAPHWPLHAKEKDIQKFTKIYRKKGWDEIREARRKRMAKMGIITVYCRYFSIQIDYGTRNGGKR